MYIHVLLKDIEFIIHKKEKSIDILKHAVV